MILRSAFIVQRAEPFSPTDRFVAGLIVRASESGAAWKPEGREAFIASRASSVKSEADAYRTEYSTCRVKVNLEPAAPAGGSNSSERTCETSRVLSKSI